jgi:AraC-like DNA-binding protein
MYICFLQTHNLAAMSLIVIAQFIVLFTSSIFSIHLFVTSEGERLLNRLLSIVFAGRLFHTLFFLQVTNFSQQYQKPFLWIVPAFVLLSPAVFYLYIRTYITHESKLRITDLLHLFPLVFFLLINIISLQSNGAIHQYLSDHFLNFQLLVSSFSSEFVAITFMRSILYLSYLFFSWRLILGAYRVGADAVKGVSGKWLIILASIISVLQAAIFTILTLVATNIFSPDIQTVLDSMGFLGAITTFLLMLYVLSHPQILHRNVVIPSVSIPTSETNGEPIRKTPYSEQQSMVYRDMIEQYMVSNQPYLDPNFSLRQLAEGLRISEHQCSSILNHAMQTSFREYINHYRIRHFIHIYASHASKYTLGSIAERSGFKSKNTFYTAFKKKTGQTPTEFLSTHSSK